MRDCAQAMGVDVSGMSDAEGANACIAAICALARRIHIPAGLRELRVREDDISELAENALKDACGFTNPVQASHAEIMAIYRAAL
ncbi:Alcohol dehydrogenase [Cronobacter universalis NCTC 9529]|nr:Alcohol dehydrogenase [Cronobacter universalis NCTC 9529]